MRTIDTENLSEFAQILDQANLSPNPAALDDRWNETLSMVCWIDPSNDYRSWKKSEIVA